MAKENTKSPLKQKDSDKRYNRQTYTGMGTSMQDRLIKGAYMSARANAPDYSWMGVVGAGIKAYKTQYDTKKALEKAKLDESLGKIETITDNIYAKGGSLEEPYFDQAFNYTQVLRDKYVAAEESGNNKEALKIKGQLNAFSTYIGTVKKDITETAEMWKDDMLINPKGMTPEQISINKSIKADNAKINMEDGTFSWKNVDYDPNDPKSKKFFTAEDLKGALPMKDQVGKEGYLKYNKGVIEKGQEFRDGKSNSGFDFKTNSDANMKLINKADDYMSWVWDDQTGQGSFADSLTEHPEFKNIFNSMNDGGKNIAAIGLYDKNGDNTVDFRDFLDKSNPEHMKYMETITAIADGDGRPVISEEEMDLIMNDKVLYKEIGLITQGKLKDALTKKSHENFNEDVTKKLVADFLTNRQRQMFYGDRTTTLPSGEKALTHTLMVPNVPNSLVTIGTSRSKGTKGQLMFGDPPTAIETIEELVEAGGNYGYMKEQGWNYKWDDKRQRGVWTFNKPKTTDPFNVGKKALDD